jgi:acyl-CoA thioesterase FadM
VVLAEGFVRIACVDAGTFKPRDLPEPVLRLVQALPIAADGQAAGTVAIPWV